MNSKDGRKKILHGNMAKIDPAKHIVSANLTNAAVVVGKDLTPAQKELMAEQARRFANENQR